MYTAQPFVTTDLRAFIKIFMYTAKIFGKYFGDKKKCVIFAPKS